MTRPDTILLVDDTRSDALLYSALLRAARPPRTVDHAPTLEAAMAMLEAGRYGAVLLDLGLPDSEDLDGLERIAARHPDLAVVVLTGREDECLGERAIAAGAQDYLLKSEASAGVIERVLRHAEARQALENQAR
ncbi:MAG: response regulator transcription factor, partial [Gammaproteobacteria bacterium]|nr:response regulator transcription factor [Gammaproteobacteria bacterium]